MNSKPFYENVKTLICVLILGFGVFTKTYGQENVIQVQGTVKDTDGVPLAGASVILVGTQTGTVSDFDGNFKLSFSSENLSIHGGNNHFLEASFVGYQKQRIEIRDQTDFHFMLSIDNQLSETIVTAQGITREKRSIGYGVSTLTAEELSDRPYTDLAQALSGKISGISIVSQTGKSSEEARIEVRTQLSIEDSREPLIVLDEIPYSGNLADINIDDVKMITVLKGLSATTLYGNEGRNGVILVETKSGDQEGNLGVSFNLAQRYYTNRVATLPAYQNQYGSGSDFEYNQTSSTQFGPHFDDLDMVPHPLLRYHDDDFPELEGVMVPYEAKPDNVSKMFNPSFGSNTTLSVNAKGERSLLNASFGYVNEGGIFGKDHLERLTFGIGSRTQISENFSVRTNVRYTDNNTVDNLGNPVRDIVNLPRNIDLTEFPYQHPIDGGSVSYNSDENPLWIVNNTRDTNHRKSFNLSLIFDLKLGEGLSLNYRGNYFRRSAFGKQDANRSGIRNGSFRDGFTNTSASKSVAFNQSIQLNMDRLNISEKMGVTASLGINSSQRKSERLGVSSSGQLIQDFFNPEGFAEQSVNYSKSETNSAGAYLQSVLNYDNYLYLTLSGRNEWGATVEPEHQSIFFPSASLSFIPSSLFDIHSPTLSFLKLRAAFASTTGFPNSYQTRPYLVFDSARTNRDGDRIVTLSLNDTFANPDLTPELHEEIELGLEAYLWRERIDLNISAFKRVSTDLIQRISTTRSTGYSSATVNLGKVESSGIEIDIDTHIVKSPTLNYNMINRFSIDGGTIIKKSHPLASAKLVEGQRLSAITGTYPIRDDEGNLLIEHSSATGVNLILNEELNLPDKIIGDSRPKWRLSSIQQLSYKQFSIETQIEYSHKGDQVTDFFYNGTLKNSLEGRDAGYVIKGVLADETGKLILDADGNKIPNTLIYKSRDAIKISNSDEGNLWDKSHFRISDVVVHYVFNSKQLEKLKLDNLRITFSATNLWYRAINFPKYVNFDPRNSGGSGAINVPSNRRFSLTLSTRF